MMAEKESEMVKWACLALVAISVLHILVLGVDALHALPGWLRLDLWTFDHWLPLASQPVELALSGGAFWSSVGSFAVPAMLLAGLLFWLDRKRMPIPAFVGWGLVAWTLAASLIMAPSGFPIAFIIALILAVGLQRRQSHHEVK
jgi:hypothetical protein